MNLVACCILSIKPNIQKFLAYFLNIVLHSCKQVQNMVKEWIPLADLPRYSRPRKRRNQSTCSSQNVVFQGAGSLWCRFVCWFEKSSCMAVMSWFFWLWKSGCQQWYTKLTGLRPNSMKFIKKISSRLHSRRIKVQLRWSESCLLKNGIGHQKSYVVTA